MKIIDDALKSKTFCLHPFTGVSTREDGVIKACCRSAPIGKITENTLEEIWNGDTMKKIRSQLLNSEWPKECSACERLEKIGVTSLRQRHLDLTYEVGRVKNFNYVLDNLADDMTMPFEMPVMEIKLNNLCNLRCRMCNPLDSTSWKDWSDISHLMDKGYPGINNTINELNLIKKPYIDLFGDKDHFWESLEKLGPNFRRLEFAGGEPLMDPQHYQILDLLSKYGKDIELRYSTNGTHLGIKGHDVFDYWNRFKKVNVNVSADGIYDVYEYVRGNGNFNLIVDNIKEIKKNVPNLGNMVIAFTTQIYNAFNIVDSEKFYTEELGCIFYSHKVQYPNFLSAQVLQPDMKLELTDQLTKHLEYIETRNVIDKMKNWQLQQIRDNITFINATDESYRWKEMVDYTNILDQSRNQSIIDVVPEFKGYFN